MNIPDEVKAFEKWDAGHLFIPNTFYSELRQAAWLACAAEKQKRIEELERALSKAGDYFNRLNKGGVFYNREELECWNIIREALKKGTAE